MRLAVVVVSVGMAASAWAATVLERIEVLRTDPLAVRLHLSAPVAAVAKALPPDGTRPDRIYLDLPDTSTAAAPVDATGAAPLLRVRTRGMSYGPHAVDAMLRIVGVDRLVLGSDRPIADPPALAAFGPAVLNAVSKVNPAAVFA